MTKVLPATTWKGNNYQVVWWDEAEQFQDRALRKIGAGETKHGVEARSNLPHFGASNVPPHSAT